jgi:hypothetical protein
VATVTDLEQLRDAVRELTGAVSAHTEAHATLQTNINQLYDISRGADAKADSARAKIDSEVKRIDEKCNDRLKSCRAIHKAESRPDLPVVSPGPQGGRDETFWRKVRPVIVAAVPYLATGFITAIVTCWHGFVAMVRFILSGGTAQ